MGWGEPQGIDPRRAAITDVEKCANALTDVIDANDILFWLSSPNPLLNGARPLDLIAEGNTDDVLAAIAAVGDGVIV